MKTTDELERKVDEFLDRELAELKYDISKFRDLEVEYEEKHVELRKKLATQLGSELDQLVSKLKLELDDLVKKLKGEKHD